MESKQFGLSGIGANVQFGKAGPRLKTNSTTLEARSADESTLVNFRAAPAVANTDVVVLSQLNAALANAVSDGYDVLMGDASKGDGSYAGAVPLTSNTSLSNAVDQLNTILGLLAPSAPPAFPNANALTVTNTAGNTPFLASGVADNSGTSTITAGSAVTRITASGVSSNLFANMGPASSGTISLLMNGTSLGSKTLTGSGDTGNYSGLVLSNQNDFPVSTPGFWKSISTQVTLAAASLGVNKFQITHSGAGNTGEVYFVRDQLTAVPSITLASVNQSSATLAYSSNIPHYTTGSVLTANASISNLAGQTYYGGSDPFVISGTNSIISSDTLTYSGLGLSTPFAANTTAATAFSAVNVNIDGSNVHNVGRLQGVAKNVNGSSTTTDLSSNNILVKIGSAGVRIDELSVTVTGLGSSPNSNNAIRVNTGSGDTPSAAYTAWSNTAALPTYEATVVGGVLKHDQTNYSTGYLPVGPNYSTGRSGAQYVTFAFARTALSQFKINVTGSYNGCWIKLPGVSDNGTISPNAAGGWWNAFQSYDGAGVPGETGDTNAGCASGTVMAGASGTYTVTFGTQSSTNATSNMILVRFRLTAGQQITALSFTN
jgi:hypothetical protein